MLGQPIPPETLPLAPRQRGDRIVYCEWFALCDHDAAMLRHHQVLGYVPICERCDDKVERIRNQE